MSARSEALTRGDGLEKALWAAILVVLLLIVATQLVSAIPQREDAIVRAPASIVEADLSPSASASDRVAGRTGRSEASGGTGSVRTRKAGLVPG